MKGHPYLRAYMAGVLLPSWLLLIVLGRLEERVSIGAFGAVLPLILVPAGVALASALDLRFHTAGHAVIALPVIIAVYYLAWKYGVASLNRIVELG